MQDRTPVGSLTLNNIDINVSLLTVSNPIFITEWISISLKNGRWIVLDQQYKLPVDGLLEEMLMNYADKHFDKAEFEKQPKLVKYFVIEEVDQDGQSY